MSILQKHVTKEILVPFTLAFLVITFLVVVGNLLKEIAGRFMNNGLTFQDMAMVILYALPTLVVYTIPIALLFATLIAFAQLSQDCEIIAMKSAGIPLRKAFMPAIAIGLATAALLLFLGAEVSPRTTRKMKSFIIGKILEKPTLVLSEQSWTPEMNNMRIFVGKIDEKRMRLEDVDIVISSEEGPRRNIVAKSGRIYVSDDKGRVFLELMKGAVHEYDLMKPDTYSTTTFGALTIPVDIDSLNKYIEKYDSLNTLRAKEMTFLQMAERFADPLLDQKERLSLLRRIGERTALAFMPLAFVLISAPLGIIPHKARRMYGSALCGGLLLAYYALMALGEALAKKGMVNPMLAMWLPNLFLGTTGLICMARAEKK
jgi:lipopolysaccharide export system permease protein